MKKLSNQLILTTVVFIYALLFIGCSETNTENTNVTEEETPMLQAASQEYADLVLKSLDLMTEFDLDKWSELLADDVLWFWPDGTSETRNTIKGKEDLIAWWKNWKETTGGQLSFANHTFLTPSGKYTIKLL
jgi:ketosteroid isomerase-like protein